MTTTHGAAPESNAAGASPAAGLAAGTAAFYRATIEALRAAGAPFLLGGAYALAHFTGVERHTKDLDVFVRPGDVDRTLAALAKAGCETELTFPHWLGKARRGADFIDVIFSSGNGICAVDDDWFAHAVPAEVLGLPARLIPPEEMVWSKAFVMERERFDGADICHLLRVVEFDWERVLRRFGIHWPVLLAHLALFQFVYPTDAGNVPNWVMRELLARQAASLDAPVPTERVCNGALLSRAQYLIDIDEWGYRDPRLRANGGAMTDAEIRHWTRAIGRQPVVPLSSPCERRGARSRAAGRRGRNERMARDHTHEDEPRGPAQSAAAGAGATAETSTDHPDLRVLMVEAAAVARGIVDNVRPEQWTLPTPCTEWNVRQIVEHLIAGNSQTATALAGPEPATPAVAGDDLAAAFAASCERLQWAYAAPGALAGTIEMPFGPIPAEFMARIRAGDMLIHAWDLARATGQPTDYAPQLNETLLAMSRRMIATVGRNPDLFGPECDAPVGASAADRYAAFLGREV